MPRNNRMRKTVEGKVGPKEKREPIKSDLQYTPGNADTIIIKLLEMINTNIGVLIQEGRNARQDG